MISESLGGAISIIFLICALACNLTLRKTWVQNFGLVRKDERPLLYWTVVFTNVIVLVLISYLIIRKQLAG
jgi:hypothetical protein